ncbi:IclR family transcriptional regulator [Zavarzinia sp.]|uniref:IclR family transcriptional regulator n=1 Tax=Zavarzinia sp. TaxID=2027920 RepID=UPI00356136B7
MSSLDRMLRLLDLFAAERPSWSAEQAIARTGYSRSTVYRYFRSLAAAGLVAPGPDGVYTLGPAVIGLDRVIRLYDPLLTAARPHLAELARALGLVAVAAPYREQILVTHVEAGSGQLPPAELARGHAADLFDSAAARVLLAHEAPRRLRRLHDIQAPAIARAGLGATWNAFRQALKVQRRVGFAVHIGSGPLGELRVAVPVFAEGERVIAALAAPAGVQEAAHVGEMLIRSARRISAAMQDQGADRPSTPSALSASWRPSSPLLRAVAPMTAERGRLA